MRCVIQKVTHAEVMVEGETVGAIKDGYMVLLGAENGDTEADARYCAEKIAGLRVFEDENDKMNLSLADVGGSVLLVSQFTLLADAAMAAGPISYRPPAPRWPSSFAIKSRPSLRKRASMWRRAASAPTCR